MKTLTHRLNENFVNESVSFKDFKKKLNLDHAKRYGYKNTKEALADGMYGVIQVSVSLGNMADLLKISKSKAMDLVHAWRDQGEVTYSGYANLEEIYFNNKD